MSTDLGQYTKEQLLEAVTQGQERVFGWATALGDLLSGHMEDLQEALRAADNDAEARKLVSTALPTVQLANGIANAFQSVHTSHPDAAGAMGWVVFSIDDIIDEMA